MAKLVIPAAKGKGQTLASKLAEEAGSHQGSGEIPTKYQKHAHVFSE
jgi:hypothetical protein